MADTAANPFDVLDNPDDDPVAQLKKANADPSGWGATRDLLSGVNTGIAGVLDVGSKPFRFGLNALSNALGYGDAVPTTGMVQRGMENANMIQPERGWDLTRKAGEGIGAGMTVATGAGAAAPVVEAASPIVATILRMLGPSNVASRPVMTGAKTVAEQAAGSTAQTLAEEAAKRHGANALGQTMAGMLAPMMPGLMAFGLKNTGGRALAAAVRSPDAARNFDTLTQAGVTPTPGLLGPAMVSRMENAATYVPFFSRGEQARNQSFRQFQNQFYDTADEMSGAARGTTTQIDPQPTVGARLQDVARTAEENLQGQLSGTQERLQQDVGPRTGVDISRTFEDDIPRMISETSGGRQQTLRDASDTIRNTEGIEIRDSQNELPPATVMPYEQVRDTISDVKGGMRRQGQPTLDERYQGGLADSLETQLINSLRATNPDLADRYIASRDAYSQAMREGGDIPRLQQAGDPAKTGQQTFSHVLGEGQWERPDAILRNAPEQAPAVRRDIFLSQGEAPVRNQQQGFDTSPMAFAHYWTQLADEMKNQLAAPGTPLRERIENLAAAGQLFQQRAGTMNFSNTAPSAATSVTMGGILSHPIETAKALGSSIASSMLATSPQAAQMMAGRYDPLLDPRLTGIVTSGLRSGARSLARP